MGGFAQVLLRTQSSFMSDIRNRKTPERVEASLFDSNSNHSLDSTNGIMSGARRTVSGSPERRGKSNDVEMSELAQPLVNAIQTPIALRYNVITAITSATGQLFIFYTIKEFGPIVFTVIMTTRQLFSITISCIIFGHTISPMSFLGAGLVFSVIFYQIRRKYLARMAAQNATSS